MLGLKLELGSSLLQLLDSSCHRSSEAAVPGSTRACLRRANTSTGRTSSEEVDEERRCDVGTVERVGAEDRADEVRVSSRTRGSGATAKYSDSEPGGCGSSPLAP